MFPLKYLSDTVEVLYLAADLDLVVAAVPVRMHARSGGKPSAGTWSSIGYALRMMGIVRAPYVRSPSDTPTMNANRRLVALALCLFALVGAQILGTPRNAGPDEPSHLIRGAGLVRGQVFGDPVGDRPPRRRPRRDVALADPDNPAFGVFDVPWWVNQPDPTCFRAHPEQPGVVRHGRRFGPARPRSRRPRRIRYGPTSCPVWQRTSSTGRWRRGWPGSCMPSSRSRCSPERCRSCSNSGVAQPSRR